MPRPIGTRTYLAAGLSMVFAVLSVVVVVLVNGSMKRLALTDSQHAAQMLLDHNLAIHTYFTKDLKPKLFERLGPLTSKDYFDPVWMSSTYAVRKMDGYFNHFNKSPYYYKECAINARSPENEADEYEKTFLTDLQGNPQLITKTAIRVFEGKPYFTLLGRGETMEETCLRCHSTPERAPGDLVRHYGPDRSFRRKTGDAVQAISIRIPLSEAFSIANSLSLSLSGLLLAALGAGFLFVWFGTKKLLISPMMEIQSHAAQMASEQDRLGETIPEPRVRELRDLGVAFNRMSVALRKTHDEQEQRILERTTELAKEKTLLATTMRSIGDGVISVDTQGKVLSLNQAAETLTGRLESEAIGRPLEEIFHVINLQTGLPFEHPVQKVIQTGQVVRLANHTGLIGRDGTERAIAVGGAPIRSETGEILGVVLVFKDVTEEEGAKRALLESEARYRNLFDNMANAVAVYKTEREGEDFIFVEFNAAAERIEKTERKEVIGRSVLEVFPAVRKFGLFEVFQRVWRTGEPESLPVSQYRDERIQGWRENFVYRLPSGEIVAIYSDETERKQAEDSLRESETRYQALFNESMDGVYITSADGECIEANEAFFGILGYEREELIGRNIGFTYADPSDRAGFVREIEAKGALKDYPLTLKRSDGKEAECHLTASLRKARDGSVVGYQGILRDITEHKALQKQLFQAQKMEAVGTLAGGIAHDFNNLLQVVLGYSELVLADVELPDQFKADMGKILLAGRNGADLIQRLLTFCRKTETKPLDLNINQRIRQTQKFLERTIPKMIDIEMVLAADLADIHADPTQVDQVLMNLAVNARDAMSEGGTLTLETSNVVIDEDYAKFRLEAKPGAYILLRVSDTGTGMNKDTLEHIFEPFFTTKAPGAGTGLGLAMVFGIVKRHNGFINCYSEVGHGTTFRIYFPAVMAVPRCDQPVVTAMPQGGAETILLVDDEEFILDLGTRILHGAGYTVLTACNGKEALEAYKANRGTISLVILDLMMPEMGGKQCLEELRKIDAGVAVLVASGYSADGPAKEVLYGGAKGLIAKPFDMRQVLKMVRETIDET